MKLLILIMFVAASCLLGLAAYSYPWGGAVNACVADVKLAAFPTSAVRAGAESIIESRIPDSEDWHRLTNRWGFPKFIAVVEYRSVPAEVACFAQTGLKLRVTDFGGHAIPASFTRAAPYGYISQCETTGVEFVAPPGSVVVLHVTRSDTQIKTEGNLIVVPYWEYEKDRLVGNMIAPALRHLALVLGTVGICFAVTGLWLYRRQR